MKKFFALLIAGTMVLSITGCKKEEPKKDDAKKAVEGAAKAAEGAAKEVKDAAK